MDLFIGKVNTVDRKNLINKQIVSLNETSKI